MSFAPVALITGSGKKRVGNVIAQALAQKGYRLAIHYRSSEAEAEETVNELARVDCQAIKVQADLGDESAVDDAVATVVDNFGQIDVLVNAAARWGKHRFDQINTQAMTQEWQANTLGSFLIGQKVGLQMVEQEQGGSIVLIGDWATVRPYRDHAAYFASKGAIPTLTRVLAVELAARNPQVRVNAILPGPVMLPDTLDQAERDEAIQATLVKREGRPENIAQTVEFLIDNDFVTGVCLPVDGGRSIYAPSASDLG